jgi:hypothetical protein
MYNSQGPERNLYLSRKRSVEHWNKGKKRNRLEVAGVRSCKVQETMLRTLDLIIKVNKNN